MSFTKAKVGSFRDLYYLSGASIDIAQLQQLLRHLQIVGAVCSRQCSQHHWSIARLVHVVCLTQTWTHNKFGKVKGEIYLTPVNLCFRSIDATYAHQYPAAVSPQRSLNVKHSSAGPCSRCRLSGSLRMAAEWAWSDSLVAGTIWRCRPGSPSDWTPWTTPDRGLPRPDAAETGWRCHSESRAGGSIFMVPLTYFLSQ